MLQLSDIKMYLSILKKSTVLSLKNLFAFILIALYLLVFYIGYLFYLEKHYVFSVLMFVIFTFCISSTFYIIGQIVKYGHFSFVDFLKSFKVYYFRANLLFVFWFALYFFFNQFVITPISSVVKGNVLLYFVQIPIILIVFFVFNVFPETIYLSDENIESVFMVSIKFMEKYWMIWILPTIIFMFLLNLFDHRLSILPTLGELNTESIIAKLQDIAFYIRSLILTIVLIFRGLLYSTLVQTNKKGLL